MKPLLQKTILSLFSTLYAVAAFAQPESQSPYSSSETEPTVNSLSATPFLWVGILLFGAVFIYLIVKKRRA